MLRTAAGGPPAVCSALLLCPGNRDGGFPSNSHACIQATLLEGRSLRGNGDLFPFQSFVSNVFLKESRAAGLGFCKGGDKL